MIAEKYEAGNSVILDKKGLPRGLKEKFFGSSQEKELARKCIRYTKQNILDWISGKSVNKSYREDDKDNMVVIPYRNLLKRSLPAKKGTDNRITGRIASFLDVISLTRLHLRLRLKSGEDTSIIATLEDLDEALAITQNTTGVPVYKLKFFNDVFLPAFEAKTDPDVKTVTYIGKDVQPSNFSVSETRTAVTARELCEKFEQANKATIDVDNLKKTYLNVLVNNGIIDQLDSQIDKRQKIYFPMQEKMSNYTNLAKFDNLFDRLSQRMPKFTALLKEGWLKRSIWDLENVESNGTDIQIIDKIRRNYEA